MGDTENVRGILNSFESLFVLPRSNGGMKAKNGHFSHLF